MDPLYIKWVQRSLNRINDAGLQVNGIDDSNYRGKLAEYKNKYGVIEKNLTSSQIGARCQSDIILQNHYNEKYKSWVRKVLPNAPVPKGSFDRLPDSSIRAFQRNEKLKVDGWIGYKTELRLIQISGQEPPQESNGGGGVPADPVVIWWNDLSIEDSYIHMSERAADDYRKGSYDPRLQCLAKKLTGLNSQGLPKNYWYFTSNRLEWLRSGQDDDGSDDKWVYNDETKSMQNVNDIGIELRKRLIDADTWFGRNKYNVNDKKIWDILMRHYMKATAFQLHQYFARPVSSREQYEQNYRDFNFTVMKIYKEVDLGIGAAKKLRDRTHGDAAMELAYNVIKGLAKDEKHIYSCFKDQMPGDSWRIEMPW